VRRLHSAPQETKQTRCTNQNLKGEFAPHGLITCK
jgi:hypothetical protein